MAGGPLTGDEHFCKSENKCHPYFNPIFRLRPTDKTVSCRLLMTSVSSKHVKSACLKQIETLKIANWLVSVLKNSDTSHKFSQHRFRVNKSLIIKMQCN